MMHIHDVVQTGFKPATLEWSDLFRREGRSFSYALLDQLSLDFTSSLYRESGFLDRRPYLYLIASGTSSSASHTIRCIDQDCTRSLYKQCWSSWIVTSPSLHFFLVCTLVTTAPWLSYLHLVVLSRDLEQIWRFKLQL